jgi:hypothetical protein
MKRLAGTYCGLQYVINSANNGFSRSAGVLSTLASGTEWSLPQNSFILASAESPGAVAIQLPSQAITRLSGVRERSLPTSGSVPTKDAPLILAHRKTAETRISSSKRLYSATFVTSDFRARANSERCIPTFAPSLSASSSGSRKARNWSTEVDPVLSSGLISIRPVTAVITIARSCHFQVTTSRASTALSHAAIFGSSPALCSRNLRAEGNMSDNATARPRQIHQGRM